MTKALIVVDVQNDFCEGGSLAVEGGAQVAARISDWAESHRGDYAAVVATRDYHVDPGAHFTDWPPHCVVGTGGEDFHPNLRLDADAVFSKGEREAAYSGFEGRTGDGVLLGDWLAQRGVDEVDVVGIATDYCVRATALDAQALGLRTRVLSGLVAGVAPDTTDAALKEFEAAGVDVVEAVG